MKKLSCMGLVLVFIWLSSSSRANSGVEATCPSADVQQKRIDAELTHLSARHRWAGEYYLGDGLGSNEHLSLAPGHGFSWSDFEDGGGYGMSWGKVRESGTVLELIPCPNIDKSIPSFGAPRQLRIVKWPERTYLVPPEKLGIS